MTFLTDTHSAFHWALVLLPVLACVIFGWGFILSLRLYRNEVLREDGRRGRYNAEHGLVIITALFLLALGNVATGFGFLLQIQALIDMAVIAIRGVIVAVAIYLVLRHPKPPPDD